MPAAPAIITAVASVASSAISADAQRSAANKAADAQTAAAEIGAEEQRQRFEAMQKLLAPYVGAGTGALEAQQNLIGLNGNGPQQAAIDALRKSPQFTSALDLGEQSILANASAIGGLRGGNTQAALAQFSPALLASLINDQYSRLGGLTSIGENAAAMTGNAGMATGNNVTQLLAQMGQAQAGAALAQGRATTGWVNGLSGALGQFAGAGGFNGLLSQGQAPSPNAVGGPNGAGWGSGAGFGNQDLAQGF